MNQQTQPQSTTFEQNVKICLGIAQLAAITVMVLLRRKIGLRRLSAGPALVMMALFLVGNPIGEGAFGIAKASETAFPHQTMLPTDRPVRPGCLGIFAAIALVAAARQRAERWREMRRGIAWHSYHRGISNLSFLNLEQSTVVRLVEPLVCILAGFLIWHWLSVALGLWLIFAGLSLRFVEKWVYKQNLQRSLDTMDGLVESEAQSETVEHFMRGHSEPQRGDCHDGVPTGLAPDLESAISRRKQPKN